MKAPIAHHRHRGRVPNHRPTDARTAFLHHRDFGRGQADPARTGQTRAASGDGRSRLHRFARRQPNCGLNWCVCAAPSWNWRAKNGLKIAAAGTHPFSSWMTQEITPQERYMGVKAGYAGTGAAPVDLRHTCTCRHRRPRIPHRRHERRALPAAAYSLSLHQFAFLDGAQHRLEIVSQHRLPQLPAQRHPRVLPIVGRLSST